ncbi:SAF domain-containing protein [Ilumatobacter sp.]|uniref:SAF domain-containing protein n=1 Tax=Ilumatobacter sp. TaxID=1967498 RepID=UPI003AF98476
MSPIASAAVTVRRILVKRPWIYWSLAGLAALAASASLLGRADAIDDARDSWGDTRAVWVATADHAPGDVLSADLRDAPIAVVADSAASDIDGRVARQHIAAGEVIHDVDLLAPAGPQAMTPPGWLAVPISESPASGAALGDRVHVVSDGFVVTADGLVVGRHDDVTLVAVPAAVAPSIPAAADAGALTLLLVP